MRVRTVRTRRRRVPPRQILAPAIAALAAIMWLLGLHTITPSEMGSTGLITHLSPILLLSYPVLIVAVLIELLAADSRQRVLTAFTMLGVVLVYGLQPASEQVARMPVAWLHIGFAQYIADHGHILPDFDARFSWPGFFSLIAFLSRASGQADMTPLLQWAPVVLTGLATLGMRALASQVLGRGRTAWLATWIFLLTEWTEQDYFSPQAVSYILMLGALAVTARYLVRPGLISREPASVRRRLIPAGTPYDRLLAQAIVLLLALALAPSHQLTPFVLGGLLLLLLLTGRLWPAWLPWLVLIPAVIWFSLGARDFWAGQLHMIIEDLGNVTSSVDQGIGGRFVGDAGRTLILDIRIGLTGVVALLTAAGWWELRRRGVRSWALPLLAVLPFGLIALQSYGGEIFVRCYLFALPFCAMLAAVAINGAITRALLSRPSPAHRRAGTLFRRRARVIATVFVLLTALGMATVTARGGNDAYTSFSRADLAAVEYAYQHASNGQSIDVLMSAVPTDFEKVGV
ncbi:MAG: hypothetical protein ACRDRL_08140, partial [Sciscionella sp.]